MIDFQKLTSAQINPYKYYNFAILHTRGLDHVLDIMRYDVAFFARKSDVENILAAAKKGETETFQRRFSILLCKYDWKGITKPNWTHERLVKGQELEEITDPLVLIDLGADCTSLRPTKGLSLRVELETTGNLPYLLETMHLNHGVPATERAAGEIERLLWGYKEENVITTQLVNYQSGKTPSDWKLPKDKK